MLAISKMFLGHLYRIENYTSLGTAIWQALEKANLKEIAQLMNRALAEIPYEDFVDRDEFWYRSLFLMLLRGAGIIAQAEVHTSHGRSDVTILMPSLTAVLEFKFAKRSRDVEAMRRQGLAQLLAKKYAETYRGEGRSVVQAVLIADDEKRQTVYCQVKED